MRNYSDVYQPKKSTFRLAWPFFVRLQQNPRPAQQLPRRLTKEELRSLFSADLDQGAMPGDRPLQQRKD